MIEPAAYQFDDTKRLTLVDHDILCFRHNEHRWVLPLIFLAQEHGRLNRPCNIVLFDYHRDNLYPSSIDWRQVNSRKRDLELIRTICESDLRKENDDWLYAGMELCIIQDAVLFCSNPEKNRDDCLIEHIDSTNRGHLIGQLALISDELVHKGRLFDGSACSDHTVIRDMLGMTFTNGTVSYDSGRNLAISIDLDYFKIEISYGPKVYTIPWVEEIYCTEFKEKFSDNVYQTGISGEDLITGLCKNTGLVAIAREENHCGGRSNCEIIFQKMNSYLFNSSIANTSAGDNAKKK
jgi:hypothetical protein